MPKFVSRTLNATEWINADIGTVVPTIQVGDMFFNKDAKKAAWETGRHSAETSLTGIYKVFVMIASPNYIIDRGKQNFSNLL